MTGTFYFYSIKSLTFEIQQAIIKSRREEEKYYDKELKSAQGKER